MNSEIINLIDRIQYSITESQFLQQLFLCISCEKATQKFPRERGKTLISYNELEILHGTPKFTSL